MKHKNPNIPSKPEMMNVVSGHMDQPEFRYFLGSVIKKWESLKVEMEIVDCIMSSICKKWGVSKEQLIQDKQWHEPRGLLFYLIKKNVKNFSYEIIGEMFGKRKSSVFEAIQTTEFLVEKRFKKDLVLAVDMVEESLISIRPSKIN